jgi:alpha-galactosidase
MTMKKPIAVIAASLAVAVAAAVSMAAPAAHADPPPFGQLPVMGYNTWYQFGAGATESAVLQQGDYLVSSGLAAAGYDTVNLDDGWMASSRTSDGSLTWDTTKFPDGIPWLASQIHALGLKFGIYEAIGTRTCQGLPGSGGTTASAISPRTCTCTPRRPWHWNDLDMLVPGTPAAHPFG